MFAPPIVPDAFRRPVTSPKEKAMSVEPVPVLPDPLRPINEIIRLCTDYPVTSVALAGTASQESVSVLRRKIIVAATDAGAAIHAAAERGRRVDADPPPEPIINAARWALRTWVCANERSAHGGFIVNEQYLKNCAELRAALEPFEPKPPPTVEELAAALRACVANGAFGRTLLDAEELLKRMPK